MYVGKDIMEKEREMKRENEKQEKMPDDEALETLLNEQLKKQVRSDYRRSLGNEACRRYKE
ncbi:MAG: hypothetical protein AB3K77_00460 [Methanosarcinaceae archaeon]|uniref:hypothetical protein n=1 Tax=Methanosarcina sp. MTP4 TaxID=1434100 RepID=UPI00064E2FF3|nr:hypothetical protein [Methanosarcina sp. MTP4]